MVLFVDLIEIELLKRTENSLPGNQIATFHLYPAPKDREIADPTVKCQVWIAGIKCFIDT